MHSLCKHSPCSQPNNGGGSITIACVSEWMNEWKKDNPCLYKRKSWPTWSSWPHVWVRVLSLDHVKIFSSSPLWERDENCEQKRKNFDRGAPGYKLKSRPKKRKERKAPQLNAISGGGQHLNSGFPLCIFIMWNETDEGRKARLRKEKESSSLSQKKRRWEMKSLIKSDSGMNS